MKEESIVCTDGRIRSEQRHGTRPRTPPRGEDFFFFFFFFFGFVSIAQSLLRRRADLVVVGSATGARRVFTACSSGFAEVCPP